MRRGAPRFWAQPPGLAAFLLRPAGAAWDMAGRLREALAHPRRPPVPVVCVGNLVAGGAGKTPVVLALADWLAGCGFVPQVVTRGWGGRLAGPVPVDPARHDAAAVGDEALVVARHARCWVARDRAAGVAAAAASGASLVLLDDGLQNPRVAKTRSLCVVDAAYGFGNGRVMPAGPLRESLDRGLARADAVLLVTGEGEAPVLTPARIDCDVPIVTATLAAVDGGRFAGARLFAFAGIGRPEKFFATLRAHGAKLVGAADFADHHPFAEGEIAALLSKAAAAGARLVTTAKDIVRVPAERRCGIEVLEVEIRWPDPDAPARLIGPALLWDQGNGRDPHRLAG